MIPVVLASTSATRSKLLAAAGVTFTSMAPRVDESAVKRALINEGVAPDAIAADLAQRKALDVSERTGGLVIGADQTLELDGQLFDKAGTVQIARERLLDLRGRHHQLHAAVALAENGQLVWRSLDTATLVMRNFSEAFLDAYLTQNADAAVGAVGGYHLEGPGIQLFDDVRGDYFAILGLPLVRLLGALRDRGAMAR